MKVDYASPPRVEESTISPRRSAATPCVRPRGRPVKESLHWNPSILVGVGIACCISASCAYPVPALTPDHPSVRIVQPATGSTATDQLSVVLALHGTSQFRSGLRLTVDGTPVIDTGTMPLPEGSAVGPFPLDIGDFANGKHSVAVTATDAQGTVHTDAIDVVVQNPPFQFASFNDDRPYYQNGQRILLTVEYAGDTSGLALQADFSQIDSGYTQSSEIVTDLGSGKYQVQYTISQSNTKRDGKKTIPVTATDRPTGNAMRRNLRLNLRNIPPSPLDIGGAQYFETQEPPKGPSGASPPAVTVIDGDVVLVAGVPTTVRIQWTQAGAPVRAIAIVPRGYSGYYLLPVSEAQTEAAVEVLLRKNAPESTPASWEDAPAAAKSRRALSARSIPSVLTALDFIALDALGAASPPARAKTEAVKVPPSSNRVTLEWKDKVDLDLHLVEPDGNEVSYSMPRSPSGAELQKDANANCVTTTRNAVETIAWPDGKLPVRGTYQIKVVLYMACDGAPKTPVSFTGSYIDCSNKKHAFSGKVATDKLNEAALDCRIEDGTSCKFSLACPGVVRGSVRFNKRIPRRVFLLGGSHQEEVDDDEPPLTSDRYKSSITSEEPSYETAVARDTKVAVTRLKAGAEEVTSGYTDAEGSYEISVLDDSTEIQVAVLAALKPQIEGATNPITVGVEAFKLQDPTASKFKVTEIRESLGQKDERRVDFRSCKVTSYDKGCIRMSADAAALSVLMTARASLEQLRGWAGRVPDKPLEILTGGSYARFRVGDSERIELRPGDVWFDFLLRHEFAHYATHHLSAPIPDGCKDANQMSERYAPKCAWMQGVADYLAARAEGFAAKCEASEGANGVENCLDVLPLLEKAEEKVPGMLFGVSPKGELSSGLVDGILLSIADTGAVMRSIFEYLPKHPDRDTNGTDLVDALDGYRCLSTGSVDQSLAELLRHYNYPYDFAKLSCLN